jgi:hypothetical protein
MKSIKHVLVAVSAAVGLASCGGGGSNGGAFSPPPPTTPDPPSIVITPASTQTTPNSLVSFTVRVSNPNGSAIADGTVVTAQVTTSGAGLVSSVAPTPAIGERVTAPTAGGLATFRFHSRQIGTATVQVSVTEPTAPNRVVTQNQNFTVVAGPPSDPRLTLAPVLTTLPVNPNNILPFVGSPYMAEVTITWRTLDGALISGNDRNVAVSVNPVNPTGGFSTLDDPTTPDVNEFQVRLGQGPVRVVAGRATVFFHSFNLPATATMTVTAVDPQLNDTVFATQQFTIVSGSPALPSSIVIQPVNDLPVFVQGANGDTSKQFETFVYDGASALLPNPPAGTNNIRLELVPGSQGGDRLRAVNGAGQTVTGPTIAIRSLNGIGQFTYEAGTRSGLVTIRATADRADNNVDNGIQDPVTSTRQLNVSDGVPFDVVITSPTQNALVVNPADGLVPGGVGQPPTVPPSPNGSYSLTVSALVTDRQGNPVPPGTPVRFGLIDAPLAPSGGFAIAGDDGNPQEGGTQFTAPTGAFTTAGGGAGPGDTLLVFGKSVPGNRDLESARVIASITSPTSLVVRDRFNFNDDTGAPVDSGPVLPYVIGRATSGNIQMTGLTDARGVARTVMTYPVSRLGRQAAIWAQTNADIRSGTPEVASDVALQRYAGAAPFVLTAAPQTIIGNRTQTVDVCVLDALGAPMAGVPIGFAFEMGSSGGTGSIGGVANSGTIPTPTGPNGCVAASVTTTGMQGNGGDPKVTFRVVSAGVERTAVVAIRVGELILTANPTDVVGGGEVLVTLRLIDQNGVGVAGAQLAATCQTSGNASLQVGPIALTNENGQTTVLVIAGNFVQIGQAPSGTCTFRTASGAPTATVRFTGVDLCEAGNPQLIPGCPGYVAPGRLTVASRITQVTPPGMSDPVPTGTITSIPIGLNCAFNGSSNTGDCTAFFTNNATLQFTLTSGGTTQFCRWEGACSGTSPLVVVPVPANGAVVCTAVVARNAANCAGP